METTINCAEACVNGCVLGDKCPHREYANKAEDFISNTSLDSMLAIADEAVRKKRMAPPQWVIPDFGDSES
jgi:anti-sigma factor ChrR (cupin superfamily)